MAWWMSEHRQMTGVFETFLLLLLKTCYFLQFCPRGWWESISLSVALPPSGSGASVRVELWAAWPAHSDLCFFIRPSLTLSSWASSQPTSGYVWTPFFISHNPPLLSTSYGNCGSVPGFQHIYCKMTYKAQGTYIDLMRCTDTFRKRNCFWMCQMHVIILTNNIPSVMPQ